MNLKWKTSLWYIVILRVWVGYYFFQLGIKKLLHGFPNSDWIGRQIGDIATLDLYPWYKSFLLTIVVPHHVLFGYLVTFGEILVGASLFLGILTRISSCAGIFILLNLFFGIGMVKGGASLAQQETFILLMVVFILSNAGKTLGLDGYLFKSKRK